MDKVVTKSKKFNCTECENEISAEESLNQGDFLECPFCGIEYEVVDKIEDGEMEVKVVEEEK